MFLILIFQIHTAVEITAEVANQDCVGNSDETATGVWDVNIFAHISLKYLYVLIVCCNLSRKFYNNLQWTDTIIIA
jgi:hypothetical protein